MRTFIVFALVALIPILWIVSIYLLRKWNKVFRYFSINLIVLLTYLYLTLFSDFKFFKEDQLGLKIVFLFIYILLFHTIANFIFALFYNSKISKNANKPKSICKRN